MALGVCVPAIQTPPMPPPSMEDVEDALKWFGMSPGVAGSIALGAVAVLTAGALFIRSQCSAEVQEDVVDTAETGGDESVRSERTPRPSAPMMPPLDDVNPTRYGLGRAHQTWHVNPLNNLLFSD